MKRKEFLELGLAAAAGPMLNGLLRKDASPDAGRSLRRDQGHGQAL